jgi:hypothetical protein
MEMLWTEGVLWIREHAVLIAGALVVIATAFATVPVTDKWEWLDFIPRRRGRMLRRARREYVKKMAVDGFVDRVEENVSNGTFTRDEAKELYRELRKCFPIRDLFPSPQLLKEAIKRRLAAKIHEPVPLPGRKPKRKLKHAFDSE